jgi:human immunodeficiency virus type I enhancer-binding protein
LYYSCVQSSSGESQPKRVKIFAGGFESNEEYTYVRGRGRGKYVCEECGIRCKKPSMLKKHIRTHTDVRPFTCKHCSFSFKTKGNLTKHMKSKAHYKKCMEMGIVPVPTVVDESNIDEESLLRQVRPLPLSRMDLNGL